MDVSLIEEWFPVKEISRDSEIEMAFKARGAYIKHCRELGIPEKKIKKLKGSFFDPKIRSIHPWFARRSCSIARSITLSAIFPKGLDKEIFLKAIGWPKKPDVCITERYPPILFYTDPDTKLIKEILERINKDINEITVCDPMAGGGSIPLESLRLGFNSIAVEYNPVAYLILKATVEFPLIYGKDLSKEVINESKKLISFAKKMLSRFYPKDSEAYIIARGFECPKCKGLIPLIHSSSLNKKIHLKISFNKNSKTFKVFLTEKKVDLPYKGSKRGYIKCPYCGFEIKTKDAYKIWTKKHIEILNELKRGIVDENKILKTHILLIKQTKQGYKVCEDEDISAFIDACKSLAESFNELEKFIPRDNIPEENTVFSPIREYGIKYWYELFNPRQLLSLAILTKYVYERTKKLVMERKIGLAISLYLSLGLSRIIDYNSIVTTWKNGTIRDTLGRYAQSRKITYGNEYCEAIIPYRNLNWIFEPDFEDKKRTEGGICPILTELCKRLSNIKGKVQIIHGDSRFLSEILDSHVDIINVDPPYFNQHIYSDISEFFWQVLRLTLRPAIEKGLLFGESTLSDWNPSLPVVPREGELIVRKGEKSKQNTKRLRPFSPEWYTYFMAKFFLECHKVLKDDGILLLWFTHKDLDPWSSIICSLYAGGFSVTNIWPLTSELLTRLVSKGNRNSLDRTLIIVARKRNKYFNKQERDLEKRIYNLLEDMAQKLINAGGNISEFKIFLRAAALTAITNFFPIEKDLNSAIQICKSKLVNKISKISDKILNDLYEKYKDILDKGNIENELHKGPLDSFLED